VVTGLSLGVTTSLEVTTWVAAGFLFGGLMLGPDLDIHSIHYKRWGWLRWIWLPYRGSMKHRSPLSHAPVTGTLIRVVYLSIWVGFATLMGLTLLNEMLGFGWSWSDIGSVFWRSLRQHQPQAIAVLVGLELGAFSHYVADWLVSTRKRVKRYGWKAALPKQKRASRQKSKSKRSPQVNASKPRPATAKSRSKPKPSSDAPVLPTVFPSDPPSSARSPKSKP
jgi:uncharacterized metal-binding protein